MSAAVAPLAIGVHVGAMLALMAMSRSWSTKARPDVPPGLDQLGSDVGRYIRDRERPSRCSPEQVGVRATRARLSAAPRRLPTQPGALAHRAVFAHVGNLDGGLAEEQMGAGHPLGRLGEPEEIALGVAWLPSDEAAS
jgi:hypothetical protein